MNPIPNTQNAEPQVKLLRARRRTYSIAMRFLLAQMLLTVATPVVGALLVVGFSGLRPYVALLSMIIVVLDTAWLDRRYKALLLAGARLGEEFDCAVLDLPWNKLVAGSKLEPEDVHRAATAFSSYSDDEKLKDWYPRPVGSAPLHLARIICQRTNLRYDSQLRQSFSRIICALAGSLSVIVLLLAVVLQSSVETLVLSMAPATPMLAWAAREYYRQRDAASSQQALMGSMKELWSDAIAGGCSHDACAQRCRELQNAIFILRAGSPLVLPFLYRFKRMRLEDEMNDAATNFLAEFEKQKVRA